MSDELVQIIKMNGNFAILYNPVFDEYYCISYGKTVATFSERNGYEELQGEKYFSRTTNKHKKQFRDYLGI